MIRRSLMPFMLGAVLLAGCGISRTSADIQALHQMILSKQDDLKMVQSMPDLEKQRAALIKESDALMTQKAKLLKTHHPG